jgi:hypothetical protein
MRGVTGDVFQNRSTELGPLCETRTRHASHARQPQPKQCDGGGETLFL